MDKDTRTECCDKMKDIVKDSGRAVLVCPCSAITGEGTQEALSWLVNTLAERLDFM